MSHYDWTHSEPIDTPVHHSAEAWMRHIWRHMPTPLAGSLPFVWKRVFGLTVLAADDPSPMRWPVHTKTEHSIVVANESRLFEMTNEVHVGVDWVQWRTTVDYRSPAGRALWAVARIGHELTLAQAVRRGAETPVAG